MLSKITNEPFWRITGKPKVIQLAGKRAFCRSGWFARRNQIRRESFLRRRRDPDLGGPQTVVSQPAATSNIGVANSNIYEHCGYNPFEPPPVFNKLAGTGAGNRNSARAWRYSDASGSRSVNTGAFVFINGVVPRLSQSGRWPETGLWEVNYWRLLAPAAPLPKKPFLAVARRWLILWG